MVQKTPFNTLLAPTDFSEASQNSFRWALQSIDGDDSVVIVLHVIDRTLVEWIASNGFGSQEDVAARLRSRAEEQLTAYKEAASVGIEVDTMVVEGLPFLEIIRKADDFAVDANVMGKVGSQGGFEKLLFGSTAEKVLRGSQRPVIVLPAGSTP